MVRWLMMLGPWALLLGVALVEPGLSQVKGPAPEHVSPSKTRSERNWNAFWRHHLGEWQGSWTRYTPSGEVIETFASSRRFTADSAQTKVVQRNIYDYADGRSIRREWNFNSVDHSLASGFAHPVSDTMRGLALDNGAAAWMIPHLERNQIAPFELFLVDGDIRHSVGVLYGTDGHLVRTTSIREERGDRSSKSWTDFIDQEEPWNPNGRWQGKESQIRADLSRMPTKQSSWQWKETEQTNHFFPDGIILRCPDQIVAGQPFSVRVVWLVNNNALQTLIVDYDSEAQLIAVTHQSLTPDL